MRADGTRLGDPARLAAVEATGLWPVPGPETIQRIGRLVAAITGAPAGLTSLLTDREHLILASGGPDSALFPSGNLMPVGDTFCAHVVERAAPVAVADTSKDDTFREIGAGTGLSAYLGVPLLSDDDQVIGAVCAVDPAPREWTPEQQAALGDLAEVVRGELRLRRFAAERDQLARRLETQLRTDVLTGLPNRRFWLEQAPIELERASRSQSPLTLVVIDLDDFKTINDTLGHVAADELLTELGSRWQSVIRRPDMLVRWAGDEFALLLPGSTLEHAPAVVDRLRNRTDGLVGFTAGTAQWDRQESLGELFSRADAGLLGAKSTRPEVRSQARLDPGS